MSSDDGLREHYLRALHLLRDMFNQLAVDHLEQAPDRVPFEVPRDVVVGWRTRAAALPLDEAAAVSVPRSSVDVELLAAAVESVLDSENESAMHGGGRSAPEDVARQVAQTYDEQQDLPATAIPLVRLALPLPVDLAAALITGISSVADRYGLSAHLGPGNGELHGRPKAARP